MTFRIFPQSKIPQKETIKKLKFCQEKVIVVGIIGSESFNGEKIRLIDFLSSRSSQREDFNDKFNEENLPVPAQIEIVYLKSRNLILLQLESFKDPSYLISLMTYFQKKNQLESQKELSKFLNEGEAEYLVSLLFLFMNCHIIILHHNSLRLDLSLLHTFKKIELLKSHIWDSYIKKFPVFLKKKKKIENQKNYFNSACCCSPFVTFAFTYTGKPYYRTMKSIDLQVDEIFESSGIFKDEGIIVLLNQRGELSISRMPPLGILSGNRTCFYIEKTILPIETITNTVDFNFENIENSKPSKNQGISLLTDHIKNIYNFFNDVREGFHLPTSLGWFNKSAAFLEFLYSTEYGFDLNKKTQKLYNPICIFSEKKAMKTYDRIIHNFRKKIVNEGAENPKDLFNEIEYIIKKFEFEINGLLIKENNLSQQLKEKLTELVNNPIVVKQNEYPELNSEEDIESTNWY
ncbi:amplified in breast cancer 2-related [Anaeramoeba flamelloides]|uniref:Nonsense-mediated mRNA decay factor SMG8 n=1 Tax=Anaeramoeba flamelloides TaxID=1746091 RepID=A0AAV7ZAE1_9EUKA|nr:amplified in breast cancer 2-related [Anaeramoeba flamelloides]